MSHKFSVLFVCLGNICRSPTAEGVFRQKVIEAGLAQDILIDSAGTSAYHIGEPPDIRSQAEAKRQGYDLATIRSRKVTLPDYDKFDLLIAMDKANLRDLKAINSSVYNDKLKLFLADFAPHLSAKEVPDPYYGGEKGFTEVVHLIELASDGLLDFIKKQF
ncbi:MAG: low molecular weight phosphotyrosine protein phosphatase [Kangiellaceae bacterium]|nr:low molecular weight phosphotyrosine protein phosphatase [Kangiellaceae bacterium]